MPTEASPKQIKNHLKEVVLLFSVPLGIIVIVMAFLYVPRLFASPTYDFVYCKGYSCESTFSVNSNGKLISSPESDRYPYRGNQLYYYDTERDSTRPIQEAAAENISLDPSSKSPDDYTLQQSSGGSGFLFWSDYRKSWSLKKGMASKPVTLESNDVKFIGWVLENE